MFLDVSVCMLVLLASMFAIVPIVLVMNPKIDENYYLKRNRKIRARAYANGIEAVIYE